MTWQQDYNTQLHWGQNTCHGLATTLQHTPLHWGQNVTCVMTWQQDYNTHTPLLGTECNLCHDLATRLQHTHPSTGDRMKLVSRPGNKNTTCTPTPINWGQKIMTWQQDYNTYTPQMGTDCNLYHDLPIRQHTPPLGMGSNSCHDPTTPYNTHPSKDRRQLVPWPNNKTTQHTHPPLWTERNLCHDPATRPYNTHPSTGDRRQLVPRPDNKTTQHTHPPLWTEGNLCHDTATRPQDIHNLHCGQKATCAMTRQKEYSTNTSTDDRKQLVSWPGNKTTQHTYPPLGAEGNLCHDTATRPHDTHTLYWGQKTTFVMTWRQDHTTHTPSTAGRRQPASWPGNNTTQHTHPPLGAEGNLCHDPTTRPHNTHTLHWGQKATCVMTRQQDHSQLGIDGNMCQPDNMTATHTTGNRMKIASKPSNKATTCTYTSTADKMQLVSHGNKTINHKTINNIHAHTHRQKAP